MTNLKLVFSVFLFFISIVVANIVTQISKSPSVTKFDFENKIEPVREQRWSIYRDLNGISQKVISFNTDPSENSYSIWKNYLFYSNGVYQENLQIFAKNLDTDETKVVFDQKNNKNTINAKPWSLYVIDMKTIENKLYFSVGGYLAPSGFYVLDLPPQNNPKLFAKSGGRIIKMNNRYWVVDNFGDACLGSSSYYTLNPTTNKINHVATEEDNCEYDGKSFIGINEKNQFILGTYKRSALDQEVFSEISLISVDNPKNVQKISAFPEEIYNLQYLKDSNILILTGKNKLYSYDFSNLIFKEIFDYPQNWQNTDHISVQYPNGSLCFYNYTYDQGYSTDFKNNKISDCQPQIEQVSDTITPEDIFKSMSLPSEYKLVLE